jgi:hypothetical protein
MPDRPVPMGPRRLVELTTHEDATAYELSKHLLKVLELVAPVVRRGALANGQGSALPSVPDDHLGHLTFPEMASLFRCSTKAFASRESRDPDIRALRVQTSEKKRLYSKRRTYEYLKKI